MSIVVVLVPLHGKFFRPWSSFHPSLAEFVEKNQSKFDACLESLLCFFFAADAAAARSQGIYPLDRCTQGKMPFRAWAVSPRDISRHIRCRVS